MIRETIHYSGRVQGVGFRQTAATAARGFAVAGYVQNLPDGRVKLVAEGTSGDVTGFVDAVQEALGGNIADMESSRSMGTGEFGPPADDGAFRVVI